MDIIKALILGIVQGITEFLPVSSSGHIELGKAILGVELEEDLTFSVLVHLATVLSTIIVFRKDIILLIKGLFKKGWNEEKRFIGFILLSAIPVLIVGLFFKDKVEAFYDGNLLLVGFMLLVTAFLLISTTWVNQKAGKLNWWKSLLIGIAQAIAVLPGISRSGATISTALNLGISKEQAARFSFLMVLIPIIGASLLEIKEITEHTNTTISYAPLLAGFIGAFISGLAACTWMIEIVKKGKIQYFAYYCFLVGIITIIVAWN